MTKVDMLGVGNGSRSAGRSAGMRFAGFSRAWRRRVLRPLLLACFAIVIVLAVVGTLVPGQAKFWAGMLAGATMTAYIALRDTPPFHVEKWRQGQEGERKTAKVLGRLHRSEWRVWHDLAGRNGSTSTTSSWGRPGCSSLTPRTIRARRASRTGS